MNDYLGLGVSPAYAAYMQQAISRGDPGSDVYQWRAPNALTYEHWTENGDNAPVSADWGAPDVAFNPQWLQSIGFTGNAITPGRFGDSGETPDAMSPELQQFIAGRGLQLKLRQLPGANAGQAQYFDAAGNPVGMTVANNLDPDQQFAIAGKLAMAIMTGGAAAAGFGSMGGALGSSLGMGSGAVGTAIGNGLMNAGMQAAVGGNVSDALKNGALSAGGAYLGQQAGGLGNSFTSGGGSIEPGFFAPGGPGDEGMFDFFGGGGGLGDFSFGGGDLGYTFDPNYMPTNAVDFGGMNIYTGGDLNGVNGLNIGNYGLYGLDNVFDQTLPGTDLSSSSGLLGGAWNAVKGFLGDKGNAQLAGGLLGALAGASGAGSKQTTHQDRMDPRMDPYVYGPQGLLAGAGQWFQQNKGGNDMMRRGAQMQADFYGSPDYASGFNQLRSAGLGLMGSPIAGNPFGQGGGAGTAPQMQGAPSLVPPAMPGAPGGRMTIMPVPRAYAY